LKSTSSEAQIRARILDTLRNNGQKAYRPKELAKALGLTQNDDYQRFRQVLGELTGSGAVARVKGGRVQHRKRQRLLEGRLTVNPRGFGFVSIEGEDDDAFVGEGNMSTALDGDLVRIALAAPKRGDDRREAEIVEVVERKRTQAVGTFTQQGRFGFVEADDGKLTKDIYVAKEDFGGAKSGDKVVVSIDDFPHPKGSPEGRVLSILGSASDPQVQVLALAIAQGVRSDFPEEVEAEAAALPDAITDKERSRRLDMRGARIFTIDPVDAKDFDDAVHITRGPEGHIEIGVHIADVSAYVRPGTALDAEAALRATSTYLVDRVIPMLPEKLSNRVCSLRPHEEKLAFSCIMQLSDDGEVVSHEVRETVIYSQHRFTYEEAQAVLDGSDDYADQAIRDDLRWAGNVAKMLTRKRMATGSVDFDAPEVRVVLGEDGHPVDIIKKERKASNRLVEEFMLLANRTVARRIASRDAPPPYVYRVHEPPDTRRMYELATYVRPFGYDLPHDDGAVRSQDLNALLRQVAGKPERFVIEDAALRAMSKAVYTTKNVGHYGLGFDAYTHFTSPIRRYPDLIVHRLLKGYAEGKNPPERSALEAQCEHCSEREKAAEQAERDSVRLKQVEYVQRHLGESFDGVVRGVTKFGLFVEMTDLLVDGLVHISDLGNDYYVYDETRYSLIGQRTGTTYKPGTEVRVTVVSANPDTRKIDLMLAE
jgi:ribonuclease R